MKFIYPAIIRKEENGRFKAFMPDLACCEATGATLDEAIENVNEAVYDWISLELEEGGELPGISEESDITLEEGDIVRNISVNIRFFDGWDE